MRDLRCNKWRHRRAPRSMVLMANFICAAADGRHVIGVYHLPLRRSQRRWRLPRIIGMFFLRNGFEKHLQGRRTSAEKNRGKKVGRDFHARECRKWWKKMVVIFWIAWKGSNSSRWIILCPLYILSKFPPGGRQFRAWILLFSQR